MSRLFTIFLWAVWCLGVGYGAQSSEDVYQLTIDMPEASVETTKVRDTEKGNGHFPRQSLLVAGYVVLTVYLWI